MEFYYKGEYINSDNLEEIEGLEEEDGTVRRRFIFKGEDNGYVFVEPIKLKFFDEGVTRDTASLKRALEQLQKYAELLEERRPAEDDVRYYDELRSAFDKRKY